MKHLYLLLILILAAGCSDRVPGSGTVTYSSGELVPSGTIFFSTPQYNYTGTIKNGEFTLGGLKENDGLPPDTYKVHLIGTEISDAEEEIPLFAPKFNSAETSGIVVEVKKGEKNRFDIVVEKP
jgi:hypothetical protein